jgi:hypothetical protein
MGTQHKANELRQFGLLIGGVFCIIGIWPLLLHGQDPRYWAFLVGGTLVAVGTVFPIVLSPVYRAWMALGHALGWVNTRIILGVMFFALLTPVGLLMRLLGKNSLGLALDSKSSTYRVLRTPRSPQHMKSQF